MYNIRMAYVKSISDVKHLRDAIICMFVIIILLKDRTLVVLNWLGELQQIQQGNKKCQKCVRVNSHFKIIYF